jgi:hypothetical protein
MLKWLVLFDKITSCVDCSVRLLEVLLTPNLPLELAYFVTFITRYVKLKT